MDVLKYWFVDENNKAACRYILVDAYNMESTIHYYLKTGSSLSIRLNKARRMHLAYPKMML